MIQEAFDQPAGVPKAAINLTGVLRDWSKRELWKIKLVPFSFFKLGIGILFVEEENALYSSLYNGKVQMKREFYANSPFQSIYKPPCISGPSPELTGSLSVPLWKVFFSVSKKVLFLDE